MPQSQLPSHLSNGVPQLEEDRTKFTPSPNTAFSCCQTELQGVNTILMTRENYEKTFMMGSTVVQSPSPYPFHQTMWHHFLNPFGLQ